MEKEADYFYEELEDAMTMMGMLNYYNPIISNCRLENRREKFFEFLKLQNLKECKFDDSAYDYLIVQTCASPSVLYNIFKEHQNKLIIFDNEILQYSKPYINLIMGAVCSSPETSIKWDIEYLNKKPIKFKGHVVILTDLSGYELHQKPEKLKYILRDMTII